MNLEQYLGKSVVAETINHAVFIGKVVDTLLEKDNGVNSIVIKQKKDNRLYELEQAEILSVEIMGEGIRHQ